MADKTGKLGLKYVVANQAQKEVTINEDLNILEMLVQATAKGVLSTPPVNPEEGDMYIIGDTPTGAWENSTVNSIAGFLMGVWNIVPPKAGWRIWMDEGKAMRYQDGAWVEEKKADFPAGIPAGGKAGQILVKLSDDDYDCTWQDPPRTSENSGETVTTASILDKIALWQPNTTYYPGDIVYLESTKLRKWYYCREMQDGSSSGVSSSEMPVFGDVAGNETIDNGIIWETYDSGAAIVTRMADRATAANKLYKDRKITLAGVVSGSASFNGGADITINTTSTTV